MAKPVILTGIRSNGELTLGNYLGAILPTIELQQKHAGDYIINMFVPDLHSITTSVDHKIIFQNSLDNLKFFVAAGLDIANSDTFIYRQSYIAAHSELTWILDCFVGMGELERMSQYKSKSRLLYSQNIENYNNTLAGEANFAEIKAKRIKIIDELTYHISVGLLNYPVLMASDILLYDAQYIPVGEDQRQHLELTRQIAIRMNNKFGKLFVIPENWNKQVEFANRTEGVRIRSLRSPEKKMSKSVDDPAGTILLTDNPDVASKKILSATTDNKGSIRYDFKNQPGISNLLQISALLSKNNLSDVINEWEGNNSYNSLKKYVAKQVISFLDGLQSSYAKVDQQKLVDKLALDEAAMRQIAESKLDRVQRAIGLRPND